MPPCEKGRDIEVYKIEDADHKSLKEFYKADSSEKYPFSSSKWSSYVSLVPSLYFLIINLAL